MLSSLSPLPSADRDDYRDTDVEDTEDWSNHLDNDRLCELFGELSVKGK